MAADRTTNPEHATITFKILYKFGLTHIVQHRQF
jgi:hypothetical protein